MKEASETILIADLGGLRRFDSNPKNSPAIVELYNIAPADKGVIPHPPVTSMNDATASWDGRGSKTSTPTTKDITIAIKDYVDPDVEIENASVYIDGVYKGVTDADGELLVEDIEVGGHTIKITAASYTDSDQDDLLNDYFVVA
jgi:hypothetical protein